MKTNHRWRLILAGVMVVYLGLFAIGYHPGNHEKRPDREMAVYLTQENHGPGVYEAHRYIPWLTGWVPFQSSYLVTREGEHIARVTLRRWPFSSHTWNYASYDEHTETTYSGIRGFALAAIIVFSAIWSLIAAVPLWACGVRWIQRRSFPPAAA